MAKVTDALNRFYNGLVGLGYSSIPPTSVLRKNYWNIYNSLNRNIGQVDYNQHINFNGEDVKIGDVITIDYSTDVDLSYQFLNKDRLTKLKNGNYQYYNYYDYAEHELNNSIGRGMSPISIGDNTFMFKQNMLSYKNYSPINTKTVKNLDTLDTLERESAYYNNAMEYFFLENGDTRYSTRFHIDDVHLNQMYNSVENRYSDNFNSTFVKKVQKYYQDTLSENNTLKDVPIGVNQVNYSKLTNTDLSADDLIAKTNLLFKSGKIKSLLGKFHTDEKDLDKNDVTSTAYSEYGLSHGKNLLKKSNRKDDVNGYDDPYCRVWTYHKQYSKNTDLIRPFSSGATENLTSYLNDKVRSENGQTRLTEKSVLRENGYVNITPKKDDPSASIKQCMFSIENLAWKGSFRGEDDLYTSNLSKEQRGPLGGRIMWFPPYDLKFSESVSSPWTSTQFIGRGEPIYTYSNTERMGNLSFKILIDHPSLINYFSKTNQDNDEEQKGSEYDLLRFFNGCDVPELQTQSEVKKQDVPMVKTMQYKTNAVTQDLVFMIYYPNNYSGIDDLEKGFDPITYILNGCGTNKVDGREWTDENVISTVGDDVLCGYEMIRSLDSFMDEYKPYDEYEVQIPTDEEDNWQVKTLLPIKNTKYKDVNHNWWYRVDDEYKGQNLRGMMQNDGEYSLNYFDTTSYHLNVDLTEVKNFDSYKDLYGINYDAAYLCSFAEFYVAMKEKQSSVTPLVQAIKANMSSESLERINIIKYMFDGVLLEVQSIGFASNEGKSELNGKLAGNRSKTIGNWLKKNNVSKLFKLGEQSSVDVTYTTEDFGTVADNFTNQDINSIESKMVKCAKVVFKIQTDRSEEITTAKEGMSVNTKEVLNNLREHKYDTKTITSSITINTEKQQSVYDNKRYDNEYEFFERINKEDTFLRHKIVDKIKYFDPAFHSISPEGFNARLTFLHQCTRQGPTVSNSDLHGGSKSAYNLAFGRQPVCVLRIGDFYNTKIVIESLNISYDNAPFDLNQEGCGVQPMIADVSISFKFLGGSDLGGPIGRLQDALSFNFYANTSVYDNRAEQIEYVGNENGDVKSYTPVNPLINKPQAKVK